MRRNDREITDFDEIVRLLNRCDTVRVAMNGDGAPYVVPLSFGCAVEDGRLAIYFHGAREGLKHTLLARDPRVCVEADILHRYAGIGGSATAEYESVIGFGSAAVVSGDEAQRGISLLMKHCGFDECVCPAQVCDKMLVYRISLDSVTGKHRFVKPE